MEGSQNRKDINELVNGGLQHISKIALRHAARNRAMVAITATESPSRVLRYRKSSPSGGMADTHGLGPCAARRGGSTPLSGTTHHLSVSSSRPRSLLALRRR